MKLLTNILLFFIIFGCAKPEIKNPEDIISVDAKAVIYISSLSKALALVPEELKKFVHGLYYFAEKDKALALVLTSLDPLDYYLALPIKDGMEEQLQNKIDYYRNIDCDFWSGYAFIASNGGIPSSLGNKSFLPPSSEDVLFGKVNVKELITGNDQILESYKKYKTIRLFRSIISKSQNQQISRFLTHDVLKFTKDVDYFYFSLSNKSFVLDLNLKDGSRSANAFNKMENFTLPEIPNNENLFSFSTVIDFSEIMFPLAGIERAFKVYLSQVGKGEAIFPMDTVFENLRKSGKINGIGYLNIKGEKISGDFLFKAENEDIFFDSISRFYSSTGSLFLTDFKMDKEKKSFTGLLRNPFLFGKVYDTKFSVNLGPEGLMIYEKPLSRSESSFKETEEKGILKLVIDPKLFLPYHMNKLLIKIVVKESILKLIVEEKN